MARPVILAPAGGFQQLVAAVRCGADAVYLGAGGFNARQNAENFGDGGLAQAVAYCHGRGVKVHVTLNTLVAGRELPALTAQLREIAESGADAVIVQDLGVAALCRECCPTLPLHASTQLSIHNAAGVRAMEEAGFSCVVLARELTAGEIAAIRRAARPETVLEAFVHGALCMSLSGQCYLSAMLGERSGNRGLCAQPCRLDFRSPYGREYALSLKDLSLIGRMKELEEAGVGCLKIEGRMKRPEYVAAATAACRAALDGRPYDMDLLRAVFSRSGFTDGYFTGKRDLSMFGWRRKEDVTAAAGVLRELEAAYRAETPRVPVSMELSIEAGRPVSLAVSDGVRTLRREGELPQPALNRPTDEALCRRALEKTGGTPFWLRSLSCAIGEGLMVPVSALNALRKEALGELLAERERTEPHPFREPAPLALPRRERPPVPELWIRAGKAEQLASPAVQRAARVILPVEEVGRRRELLSLWGEKLAAELPVFTPPGGEGKLLELLSSLREEGLSAGLCPGPGAVELCRRAGLLPLGDYGLGVMNPRAADACRRAGVRALVLSFEGNLRQLRELSGGVPLGVVAYGHLPLMTFRACPAQGPRGCGGCTGRASLRDRLGKEFPVLCREKVYSQLLNPIPLYLGDRQEALRGFDFVLLRFTAEDPGRCARVLELWQEGAPFREERTGGLYFRELK